MTRAILLVDDEKQILRSLQRVFAETEYEIYTANSGPEALQLLAEVKVDLVISDMRMPHMDGHSLLKKVKSLYPATLRIILSGYTDENQIFKSLLDGSSRLYLLKPWDNDHLLRIVRHMFEIQELLRSTSLLQAVAKIEHMATLPAMYHKLVRLIEMDADIKAIAEFIETDPVAASKVLHLANSAFNGVRTGSIQQALVYLGLEIVKDLVLTLEILERSPRHSLSFSRKLMWQHAGLTNQYTHILYERLLQKKIPDNCSTAGLLHDIGKIFLLGQYPEAYMAFTQQLQENPRETQQEYSTLEQQMFGVTHTNLGGYLLNWWELPYPIVEAALFHHSPEEPLIIHKELAAIVHLADYCAWRSVERSHGCVSEYALRFFDLKDEEQLVGLIMRAK